MKGAQRSIITLLNLSLIAAMLSSSFLATRGFFNDPITSKQYGLEIICLSAGLLFVITFAFKNQIIITNIDLLVLAFCGWHILSEVYIFRSPYITLSDTIFNVSFWLTVYLFVRSAAQEPAFGWWLVFCNRVWV